MTGSNHYYRYHDDLIDIIDFLMILGYWKEISDIYSFKSNSYAGFD